MNVLVIAEEERAQIKAALAEARKRPLSLEEGKRLAAQIPQGKTELTFEDRKNALDRPSSIYVLLPRDYRVAISFEEHPIGLVRHLSISVSRPGYMPSLEACNLILEIFGVTKPVLHLWMEEFEPGHHAINFLKLEKDCTDLGPPEPTESRPPTTPSAGHPSPGPEGATDAPPPAESPPGASGP
jgi:hypothetical protein